MSPPSIAELPPPPAGKAGWPWTVENPEAVPPLPAGVKAPRITVITPSYNQAPFLEECLRSVLLQGYSNLEYFVLDGGSRDGSEEIIRKYEPWLDFWVSERDGGQSAAINRGLAMGTGLFATWINSDDMLCEHALNTHVARNWLDERAFYVGDCVHIDHEGKPLSTHRGRVHSLEDLVRVEQVWRTGGSIDQPATIFPLHAARKAGGVNARNHYTMDYELWGQLFLQGIGVRYTGIPIGLFRWHEGQKTGENVDSTNSMLEAAARLIERSDFPAERRKQLLTDLETYRAAYPGQAWQQSGRLARLGLPASLVGTMRAVKSTLDRTIEDLTKNRSK